MKVNLVMSKYFVFCCQILLMIILAGCYPDPPRTYPLEYSKVTYRINIQSEPSGAKLYVNSVYRRVTPYVYEVQCDVYKGGEYPYIHSKCSRERGLYKREQYDLDIYLDTGIVSLLPVLVIGDICEQPHPECRKSGIGGIEP